MAEEKTTTLDDDVTKPSVTEPGDGPADTTDPDEVATSVTSDPSDEAVKAGTVNAVRKTGTRKKSAKSKDEPRVEKYTQVRPDGKLAHIERNIETGESTITKIDDVED